MKDSSIVMTIDVGCPWMCYLGWKRLQNCLSLVESLATDRTSTRFQVTYQTISINPALPTLGVSREEYLLNKMSHDALNNAHSRLRMLGEAEGIKYGLEVKIGNTRDAHRLLYLGKTKSAEIEELLLSIIFRTHFEEDGDITSHEALIACGKEAGLDKVEVRNWLKNNGGGREVDRDNEEAGKQGITAVPHLRINGQYELRGTPDSQFLLQILTDK